MSTYDVIIVGAAPAGSVAALVLARAGHRVALIDRAAFPRVKVCGNCINPAAWQIWNRLGLRAAFESLPHQELTGFTLHSEGRQIFEQTFRPPHRGPRAVARDLLDDWLRREAQGAGAKFLPETTVTGLDSQTGMVQTSRGDFSARLVLGADGRNSQVARQTGLMPPPRRCHRIAWQASVPAPTDLDDHVHMHLFEEGYFGICRYNSAEAVISMVLDSRRTQDPLALVRRVFPRLEEQSWLRMNPITRAPARIGTNRVWLIGDAARVVEPFTGEGITFALSTGILAAETACEGLARNNFVSAFNLYAREHRRLYRRRAWVNTLMRWALTTPAWPVRLLRRMKPSPVLVSFLSHRVHATG
ncbi:MAG: NAD(P)/FAD-dependent oxidoreductase [Methylacidiphilales bacterium]|nr:NAD(P)/FAD-dependent oxidoreductase [Candidatus Methylacidiphilales bacterium]